MGEDGRCPHCKSGTVKKAPRFYFGHELDAVLCSNLCGWMQYRCDTVKPEIPLNDSYQWKSSASRQRVVEAARGNGKKCSTRSALRLANERIKQLLRGGYVHI